MRKLFIWTAILSCVLIVGVQYYVSKQKSVLQTYQKEEAATDSSDSITDQVGEASDQGIQTQTICVFVCGCVKKEGVYELPISSRVIDGIEAAGGFTEEASTSYLNLADEIADGDKLYVPTKEEAMHLAKDEQSTSDGLVDLNEADVELLMTLSGIGETRAKAIINYREENGDFGSIEDIMLVPGIKEATFQQLREQIYVKK